MKTPIEIEYRVVYDQRGWNDDAIWTKRYAEFTERAGADEFAAWVGAKDWARYVEIQQRESVVWAPCIESTPPVELPTEPTLGWVTTAGAAFVLDRWRRWGDYFCRTVGGHVTSLPVASITAFTPAVAVPASALDELRAIRRAGSFQWREEIDNFLTAVDTANGGDS